MDRLQVSEQILTIRSQTHVNQGLGDEIYDAIFDKRKFECVKVLNKQDHVVPKIDYAICLHFETCPKELKRTLSRHEFTSEKLPTKEWNGKIPYGETLAWFNPTTLGDTHGI